MHAATNTEISGYKRVKQAGVALKMRPEENTARELQIATCGFHHTSQGILSFLIKMK